MFSCCAAVAIFYVIFLFIAALFYVNLFVGIVIDTFNELKLERETKGHSEEQLAWISTEKAIAKMKPQRKQEAPSNKYRAYLWRLVTHPWFDRTIMGFIVANIGFMCVKQYNQSDLITEVSP